MSLGCDEADWSLVTEPLAMAFHRSASLQGVEMTNGKWGKCCLYADDTATFPPEPGRA